MKKLMIAMIFLCMFALSGCNNKEILMNDFFENEKSDDIEVLMEVVDMYDDFIYDSYDDYLSSTYPLEHRTIQHLDEYVSYDQSGKIYKEDMVNYDLTDNRSYLIESSDIYFYLHESRITAYCDDIKEGVKCYDDKEQYYLLYYVDGNQAYVEYQSVFNNYTVHLEKMYYYTNELDEKVFEYTHQERDVDKVEYDYITKTTLIEDVGEVAYSCISCNLSDRTGLLNYSSVSFTHGGRKHIYQSSDTHYKIKILNGVTQEFYWGFVNDDESSLTVYEQYQGNIKLVEMNPKRGIFTINLNALDGWSYIDKADTDHLAQQYHLYDEEGQLIDDIYVRLAITEGDYVYYNYDGVNLIPDDILDMSRFGLEAPYSMAYYLDQEQYFQNVYQIILEHAHMDRTFDMSYDYFMRNLDIE